MNEKSKIAKLILVFVIISLIVLKVSMLGIPYSLKIFIQIIIPVLLLIKLNKIRKENKQFLISPILIILWGIYLILNDIAFYISKIIDIALLIFMLNIDKVDFTCKKNELTGCIKYFGISFSVLFILEKSIICVVETINPNLIFSLVHGISVTVELFKTNLIIMLLIIVYRNKIDNIIKTNMKLKSIIIVMSICILSVYGIKIINDFVLKNKIKKDIFLVKELEDTDDLQEYMNTDIISGYNSMDSYKESWTDKILHNKALEAYKMTKVLFKANMNYYKEAYEEREVSRKEAKERMEDAIEHHLSWLDFALDLEESKTIYTIATCISYFILMYSIYRISLYYDNIGY